MAKKSGGKKRSDLADLSFEQAAARLEQIADELETGKLELDVSLARYEEGVKLSNHCRQMLQQAEQKIDLLTNIDREGNVHTEPFDNGESQMDETGKSRSARRSANRGSKSDEADDSRLF